MKNLLLILFLAACTDETDEAPTCRPTDDEEAQATCDASYGAGVSIAYSCDPGAPKVGPGYENCYLTCKVMCCK